MHRLMTAEEKKDLKLYLESLADNGKIKREGIENFLKNDLIVPQCSECKNDIRDWMGDDKAIQLGDDDYICTACEVLKTRKSFKRADQEYGESLPEEERKKIEETLAEDKELNTKSGEEAKELVKKTVPNTPEIVSILQDLNESLKESKEINKELLNLLKPQIHIGVPQTDEEPKFTRKEIDGGKTIQSNDTK